MIIENQKERVDSIFSPQMAASYDTRPDEWIAGRDSLLGFVRVILSQLPGQSHVLCIGAGTGVEVEQLAQAFPDWYFTIVEPSSGMMAVCRQRMTEGGLTERCTFHEGFIDSLPPSEPFDAATCLLVSHFMMQPAERSAFFAKIAALLRPSALLVSSDLSADMNSETYTALLDVFLQSMRSPQMSQEQVGKWRDSYGRDVAVIPTHEIEAIITAGGFEKPTLFFQNLLIHAWFSRRRAELSS